MKTFLQVIGFLALVGGLVAYLGERSGVQACQSFLGQLSQGLSSQSAQQCQTVQGVSTVGLALAIGGATLLLITFTTEKGHHDKR